MSTNTPDTPVSNSIQTSNRTPAPCPCSPTFLNLFMTIAGTAIKSNSIVGNNSSHNHNVSLSRLYLGFMQIQSVPDHLSTTVMTPLVVDRLLSSNLATS
eukprot:scaffold39103_cov42-Cyclotella_meneghiniana.AAC.2